MKAKEYLETIFKYFKNMSDAEDFTFCLELLRRKIRLGKFTRPCIFYCKRVILDIFQNVSGIWKTILLSYCLA